MPDSPEPKRSDMESLNREILGCAACPRLSAYIRGVAATRTRRFMDCEYHGKPLPGFGDINARLLVVGLAPAAHGGNRTGRMFTGDSSASWLSRAMHEHGFASIPTSVSADDGLALCDAFVTAAARCAPPQNKPTAAELDRCLPFLRRELAILNGVEIILCLGGIAYRAACKALGVRAARFGHNLLYRYDGTDILVLTSYHPSRQNTQTGRLSWEQWDAVFARARSLLYNKGK